MKNQSYMFRTVKKTLDYIIYNIGNDIKNPHSVMESVNISEALCRTDTSCNRLSGLFLLICEKAKTLYFRTLALQEALKVPGNTCAKQYFSECRRVILNTLSLFSTLLPQNNEPYFPYARNTVLAETEAALCCAKTFRLAVLNSRGKIFSALPELEFIYECTEILRKTKMLLDIYDIVYNKFTVST